jgi:hypothetical protein
MVGQHAETPRQTQKGNRSGIGRRIIFRDVMTGGFSRSAQHFLEVYPLGF